MGSFQYITKYRLVPIFMIYYCIYLTLSYLPNLEHDVGNINLIFTSFGALMSVGVGYYFWKHFPKIRDVWFIRDELKYITQILGICTIMLLIHLVIILNIDPLQINIAISSIIISLEIANIPLFYVMLILPTKRLTKQNKNSNTKFAVHDQMTNSYTSWDKISYF